MEKHPEIKALEKQLGFQLNLLEKSVLECMRYAYQGHYVVEADQVVALNLRNYDLKDHQMEFLQDFPALKGLNLMGNSLTHLELPSQLAQLVFLNGSENADLSVLKLPPNCQKLEVIDLNECSLKSFSVPANTDKLKKLNISRNKQLRAIQFQGGCPTLLHLDLSDNQLQSLSLPSGFQQLRYLYLNDNELNSLEFGRALPALKTLHLRNNQLDKLPAFILGSTALEAVYMHGNPWKEIPAEFIDGEERKSSWEKVRGYLKPLVNLKEDEIVENDEVKLVLLGNSTVGKSSLIKYLRTGQYNKNEPSTHGIINVVWDEEDHPKLQQNVNIWDFGGQEFYHATHRLFLSSNAVTLVLFDNETNVQGIVTTKVKIETKDTIVEEQELDMEHFPYEYWLDTIAHYGGYFKKEKLQEVADSTLLVQTKFIKYKETEIPVPDTIRNKYGFRDANIHRIDTEETFNGSKNAIDQFQPFQTKLFDTLEKTTRGFKFPGYWLTIKEEVRKRASEGRAHLMYAEYQGICEGIKENISILEEGEKKSELENLTEYLHKIGVLLHFKDDANPLISNRIFIDPKWVTETIYEVLDYEVVTEQEGTFDINDVQKVVRSKGIEAQTMIDLMKAFKLIFTVKDQSNQFVAPQYLPTTNPEGNSKSFKNTLKECSHHLFSLHYPTFLPRSIMTGFLCNYGNLSEHLYWRDGTVIQKTGKDGNLYKFLIERQQDTWQTIAVLGQTRDEQITQELFQAFMDLSKEITNLHISVNGSDFVALKSLNESLELGNSKIRSQNGNICELEDFNELLFGKQGFESASFPHRTAKRSIKQEEKEEEENWTDPKVLFLSSCPKKYKQLRFNEEQGHIEDAYKSGLNRTPGKEPEDKTNVQGNEILSLLKEFDPEVLHISVHGSRDDEELIFSNRANDADRYKPEDFQGVIKRYQKNKRALKLILLNACHSIKHAEEISQYADFVIGMQDFIPDDLALTYTEVFYKNLFAGIGIKDAHDETIAYIRRQGKTGFKDFVDRKYDFHKIPVIFHKGERL